MRLLRGQYDRPRASVEIDVASRSSSSRRPTSRRRESASTTAPAMIRCGPTRTSWLAVQRYDARTAKTAASVTSTQHRIGLREEALMERGLLANIFAIPPLIFRFQYNPELLQERKRYKYQQANSFGRWRFDQTTAASGFIDTVSGLWEDLKEVGPLLTATKPIEALEGEPRQYQLEFQLDALEPGPMDTRRSLRRQHRARSRRAALVHASGAGTTSISSQLARQGVSAAAAGSRPAGTGLRCARWSTVRSASTASWRTSTSRSPISRTTSRRRAPR